MQVVVQQLNDTAKEEESPFLFLRSRSLTPAHRSTASFDGEHGEVW